jgi:tetratricopeptide (TPR) repeat protein
VSGRGELAPEELRVLTDQMSTALEVEALLVAWVPEQRLTKDVWLNLFAKGTTAPDVYSVNYLDPEAIPGFIAKLAEPTPLSRSWIGLRMIDTRLYQGAAVMRIEADGPAAGAGIELGDVVVGSGERTITRASDLLQVVAESAPESALKLAIQGGREVQIRVGSTPIEIPLNRPGYLYNKSIIDLRHRLVAEPEVEPLARLNLALAHLQLGDIETALKEQLPRIKFAGTRGISQGTAAYYWALCYEKLGERGEAVRLYQEAAKHAEATLRSNDGPRVAPLAERKLRELGGAQ